MAKKLTVKLDGKEVDLVATLGAARTVNAQNGGFGLALQQVRNCNMQTIALVVAAGIGKTEADEINAVEESIYAAGVAKFVDPAGTFITRLANGGEDPVDHSSTKKEAPKGNPENG